MDLCSLAQLLEDLKIAENFLKDTRNITFKEAVMLCAIGNGFLEPAKLAKQMNLSPSRASRLISALELKNLTTRRTSSTDKRIINLNLSKKGKLLLEELHNTELPLPDYLKNALKNIENNNFNN